MIVDRNWAKPSGGGVDDNTKLKEIIEGTVTEITAEDLAGVTKIKPYTFYEIESLTSITLPQSLKSIGNYAFCRVRYVETITIPDSVTSIGDYAFNPSGIGGSFKNWGTINISENSQLSSIGSRAFQQCYMKQIYIPDGVKIIPSSCFSGCSYLENVRLSNNLTTISSYAFQNCNALKNIEIPNSVNKINSDAFQGCTGLTSINIPDSVTHIDGSAFLRCTSLITATIGKGVTYFGYNVFSGCTALTEITILATAPPTVGTNFAPTTVQTIRIPAGTLEAYSTATNWADYADKFVELPAE